MSVAGDAQNGVEAYARLQSSHIAIVSPGKSAEMAESLAKLLNATGIGFVTCLTFASAKDLQSDLEWLPPHTLIVVLSLMPEDPQLGLLIDSYCAQRRMSWLRAGLDRSSSFVDIGPLFGTNRSICYSCFLSSDSLCDSPQLNALSSVPQFDAELYVGLVATEII